MNNNESMVILIIDRLRNRGLGLLANELCKYKNRKEHEIKTLKKEIEDLKRQNNQIFELIRDKEDRYGVGHMNSQWTSEDIADDIMVQVYGPS